MEQIYTLLQDIRKRYALYIEEPSIEKLSYILSGYEAALNDILGPQCAFNYLFQHFVENKDNAEENMGKHWSKIISNGRTEKEAFEKFFEYADEFFKGIKGI